MTAADIAPSPGTPSPARRRWLWLITVFLGLIVLGCLVWTLSRASDLGSANDARHRASAALASSRGAQRFAASRLAGKRQSAISPSRVGHQVVDLARQELDLDTQTATVSRQSIQAVLNRDADAYNAARDQLNSLVVRSNALVSQIDVVIRDLFAPAGDATDRSVVHHPVHACAPAISFPCELVAS
jgi:hypothetical protein